MESDYELDTVSVEPRSSGGTPQSIRKTITFEDSQRADEHIALQMPASVDDSPPVPSLLICPSHWSALLESTPVSLVMRREGRRTPDGVGWGEEGGGAMVDNSITPQGRQSPERDQECQNDDTEREVQISELNLQMESDPESDSPVFPSPSLSCTALPSSMSVSITIALPLEPRDRPPLDSRPQLSVHMEEDEDEAELQGTRGGAPSQTSLVSEGEAPSFHMPGYMHHTYQTHSRNVSETPSLPPFYSSSTSSAYHSRNSSLGSQLSSSCFESDSMLSQITDRDSSYAGSHGDLKQPIGRLQDSRLRTLDSSPGSYSSDLGLSHHMTQPIRLQNMPLLGDSPNFEETLRSGRDLPIRTMAMVENKKLRSFKSSEWIKKRMEKGSLVQVKVSSKTKHVVHFNVKAGDVIIWEFATKKRDIGFSVSFEATEVATEQTPLSTSHESLEKKMTAILPLFRVSAHARPTVGSHTALHDGVYEIIWDNTYSRFFAKELYYRITTEPSEPNVNYLQQ